MAKLAHSLRAQFEHWQSVVEFEDAIERTRPEESSLRSQEFKFWREAWVAAQFARISGQSDVRLKLTSDSSPEGDFQMEGSDGVARGFEIAEALDPTMPAALKKLREMGGSILRESDDSVSGARARAEIPRLIAQKAAKGYPVGTGLIIYVNLWTDFERVGTGGLVPTTTYQFASIWLLTLGKALRIFPV